MGVQLKIQISYDVQIDLQAVYEWLLMDRYNKVK